MTSNAHTISRLRGLGVAMVTPFTANHTIDFGAVGRMVDFLTDGGVNYLVVLGTTGESVVISPPEQEQLLAAVKAHNQGRLPIVVGIGGNNTQELIDAMGRFDFGGVDAVLSVTPYYNKPTQKGLELHYRALAQRCPVPIILYNVPGRTGVNMTAETTLKLAREVPSVVAIKEASGSLNQQAYLLRDRPEGFLVLSGDDGLTLPQLALGFDGVISVVGNAFPKEFARMVNLALAGRFEEARRVHLQLVELIDTLFVEGNPAGVKAALSIKGLIDNQIRLPLAPVSDTTYQKLQRLVDTLGR